METTWQKTLAQLQEFVKYNPGISIGANMIVIPSEVRTEFYKLFDKVEADFVKDYATGLLDKSYPLGKAWAKARKDITSRMSLESVNINPAVAWFLNDPVDGLGRYLSDPLFEVLKGNLETSVFEAKGRQIVEKAGTSYYQEGYRRWAGASILSLLDPDKNFRVPAIDEISDTLMGEGHENPGQHIGIVPEGEESKILSFQQHHVISFIVPKILVHSALLGRFVGMHSEFVEPQWTAREVSRQAEWFDFLQLKRDNGLTAVRPDQKFHSDLSKMLPDISIYTAEYLEDISLVSDHRHILRPDLAVEVMEAADWFEKGQMARIKRHHAVMEPRFGTFIVCLETPPQAALDELAPKPAQPAQPVSDVQAAVTPASNAQAEPIAPAPEPPLNIHILNVGYDKSRLAPIVEALRKIKPAA